MMNLFLPKYSKDHGRQGSILSRLKIGRSSNYNRYGTNVTAACTLAGAELSPQDRRSFPGKLDLCRVRVVLPHPDKPNIATDRVRREPTVKKDHL